MFWFNWIRQILENVDANLILKFNATVSNSITSFCLFEHDFNGNIGIDNVVKWSIVLLYVELKFDNNFKDFKQMQFVNLDVDCLHYADNIFHQFINIVKAFTWFMIYNIVLHAILCNKLTPFFSQTPPAFLRSPVQASPNVPISKSLYVNIYAKQKAS